MAFIPCPNCVEVSMNFTRFGQEIVSVFHVDNGGPVAAVDVFNIVNVFYAWWNLDLGPNTVASVVLNYIKGTDLTTSSGPVYIGPPPLTGPGGSPGTDLPNDVTLAVAEKTASRGRSYRGRWYFPGLIEAHLLDSNHVSAVALTEFITLLSQLSALLSAASKVLVVLSRFHNGSARVTGVMTPVTTFGGDNILDSQRRRLPGRGR